MKSEKKFIPDEIWKNAVRDQSHSTYVGNLVLRNGRVYKNIFINHRGMILGEVVGGHDGISSRNLDFAADDIKEIRRLTKVAAPKTARQSAAYMLYMRAYGWIRKRLHRHRKKRF